MNKIVTLEVTQEQFDMIGNQPPKLLIGSLQDLKNFDNITLQIKVKTENTFSNNTNIIYYNAVYHEEKYSDLLLNIYWMYGKDPNVKDKLKNEMLFLNSIYNNQNDTDILAYYELVSIINGELTQRKVYMQYVIYDSPFVWTLNQIANYDDLQDVSVKIDEGDLSIVDKFGIERYYDGTWIVKLDLGKKDGDVIGKYTYKYTVSATNALPAQVTVEFDLKEKSLTLLLPENL